MRARPRALLGLGALVAAGAVTAGAVAVASGASGGREEPGSSGEEGAPAALAAASPPTTAVTHAERGHAHGAPAPYAERYAAASPEERAAADELRAAVRDTLTAYAEPDDAVAAGYRPPRHPRGRMAHYLGPSVPRSGTVLDATHPAGLVYDTGGGAPVLVGAFFVAPRGTEVPGGTGDLVTWHSHDPTCAAFFATPDEPCTGARRMLHVWTVDTATLTNRRGEPVDVEVVDPFGAPFVASVERVG